MAYLIGHVYRQAVFAIEKERYARQTLKSQGCAGCLEVKRSSRKQSTGLKAIKHNASSNGQEIEDRRLVEGHYQALLNTASQLSDEELRIWFNKNRESVTLDFLLWISDRPCNSSRETSKADLIGGKLTALRENLDPLAAQQMLDRMFQVNVLPEARNESELESSFSEREDIEQKARFDNNSKLGTKIGYELVHQRQNLMTQLSQKAMSIPEIHRALNRAEDFAKNLEARKASSTAEVIGRADIENLEEAEKFLNLSQSAERILEVIVSCSDREERKLLIYESFQPPESSSEKIEPEEELLFTTPFQLMQAAKLAQSRENINTIGNGSHFEGFEDLRSQILEEIRQECFQIWDAQEVSTQV